MVVSQIFKRHGLAHHDGRPLWKYDVSDNEFLSLEEVVLNDSKNDFRNTQKEIVFYIAEWWQRNYSGGHYAWRDILESIGLEDKYQRRFETAAIAGGNSLKLKWIRNNRTEYFRTLLLQGGLPIQRFLNVDNDAFTRFFSSLLRKIKIYREEDYTVDKLMNNHSDTPMKYLPNTFRQYEIVKLCRETVLAILNDRSDMLPFSENIAADLIRKLREVKAESHSTQMPFKIKWQIIGDKVFYKGEFEKELSQSFIKQHSIMDNSEVCILFNDVEVARYLKNLGGSFYLYSKNEGLHQWDFSSDIVCLMNADHNEKVIHIPGEYAPDLNSAFLCKKDSEKDSEIFTFMLSRRTSAEEGVVGLPDTWKIACDNSSLILFNEKNINEKNIKFYQFSGDCFVLSPENDKYKFSSSKANSDSIIFRDIASLSWIVKSSIPVYPALPKFASIDEEGNLKNVQETSIKWRYAGESIWKEFTSERPENGSIIFMTEDGQYLRCFIMKDITFDAEPISATEGTITISNAEGVRFENSDSIFEINETEQENRWRIEQKHEVEPATILRINFLTNHGSITVDVVAPFKGAYFSSPEGKRLRNNTSLPFNSLDGYRIITVGDSYRATLEDAANKDLSQTIDLNGNSTPLWKISDAGQIIFTQNDACDARDYHIDINDNMGQNCARLVLARYNANRMYANISEQSFSIIDANNQIIKRKIPMFIMMLGVAEEEISIIEIENFNDGEYFIPDEIFPGSWIVFSRKDPEYSVYPSLYYKENTEKDDLENNNFCRATNIPDGTTRLDAFRKIFDETPSTDLTWQCLSKYAKIMYDNNIPLSAYDPFKIVAKDDSFLVKFFFALQFQYANAGEALSVLKQLEEHLPINWQVIPIKTWQEQLKKISEDCGENYYLFNEMFKRFSISIENLFKIKGFVDLLKGLISNPDFCFKDIVFDNQWLDDLQRELGNRRFPRAWNAIIDDQNFRQLMPKNQAIKPHQKRLLYYSLDAALIITGHKQGYYEDPYAQRRLRLLSQIAPNWFETTCKYFVIKIIRKYGVKNEF